MAIQNFLSGGFYGSIGALTGRRWKNKRVVQKKFKPANPRTPAQQAQRNLFTRGSALAKLAQQINYKAPQFENPIRTDWNQRQTVAINALKNGQMDWEALPLAPVDFKASHIIGTCSVSKINSDNTIEFLLQGTNLETSRNYACVIFIQSGTRSGQKIVGVGQSDSSDASIFTARFEDNSGISGEECFIKIASYGDTSTETVTLSAGIYLQQAGVTPYKFTTEIVSIALKDLNTLQIKIKIGEEEIESYDSLNNISVMIYGKYWLKETAVFADILDEENAQEATDYLTYQTMSISKKTATVTYSFASPAPNIIEKYNLKLDIKIDAVNVKGIESDENSQELELLAQDFPTYLQDELQNSGELEMTANCKTPVTIRGTQLLQGQIYLQGVSEQEGTLITSNGNDVDWEDEDNNITSVVLKNGSTVSGDSLEEMIGDYGFDWEIEGGEIAFGIPDNDLTKINGSIDLQCVEDGTKWAFAGWRVVDTSVGSWNLPAIRIQG